MIPVTLTVVAHDDRDPAPVSRIVSVTADPPPGGSGTAARSTDWEITGSLTVNLRAEGTTPARTYTIIVACSDASGNTSTAQIRVQVLPPNLRR